MKVRVIVSKNGICVYTKRKRHEATWGEYKKLHIISRFLNRVIERNIKIDQINL